MKKIILLLAVVFICACDSHQTQQQETESAKLTVVSVNYPLHYFAQRIAGDLIQTEYPIPADVDPAYWIPDEKALEVFQAADIILANGADYAKWMNNVSLPSSRIVNTSSAFEEAYIALKDVSTHSHGPEGEHEHTGYAFTTWLDFEFAAGQAESVKNALINKLPDPSEILEANFNTLQSDLLSLHKSMILIGGKMNTQHIIGSHPVYQYLSQAYGLQIHSVHFEPDEMPSKDQWDELAHLLDHYPAKIMLWEDEPLPEMTKKLKTMNIEVVVFNPCGNQPDKIDFLETMKNNIAGLQKSQVSKVEIKP